MLDGFGFLGWLFLLLMGGRGASSQPAPGGAPAPRPPPQLPPGGGQVVTTTPWPQVAPSGLPPFPGSGWEFDEPPPIVVQQRAGQLVNQLWAAGKGTHKIEQTAGRWIAYRAEIVRSGKKGVVAYRLATKKPVPAPTTAQRPPAPRPAAPAAPRPAAPRVVTSPGMPQPPGRPAAPQVPAVMQPAASMPVAPASALALPLLRRGAGIKPKAPDPNVRILQNKLGIPADGQFGGGTEAAVVIFQRKVGLTPDGIVGPKTWTALFAIRA